MGNGFSWLTSKHQKRSALVVNKLLDADDRFVHNSVIRNYRDSNLVNGMVQMGRRNCPCLINIG